MNFSTLILSIVFVHLWWVYYRCCCPVYDEIVYIPNERELLLKLKYDLKDSSNRLSSWNSNCCEWNKIAASGGSELHLTIQFPSSGESLGYPFNKQVFEEASEERYGGEINPCLVDLKHLSCSDFRDNLFRTIPIPSFIATITSLTHLNLSIAGIIGSLPSPMGNVSDSVYLDLESDETWVTDNIDWVLSLSKLRYLGSSTIWAVGGGMPIPSFLGTMTALVHLARKKRYANSLSIGQSLQLHIP